MLREVAQVLGHLGRAGRAVQADHVGLHRFERGERGADLGADEHAAGRLDRDLHHERDAATRRAAIARRARDDRGLALEQVVDGLDEQHVDAAREQAVDLRLVVVAQRRRSAIWPSDGSLVPGPDRADHEPGPVGRSSSSAATSLAMRGGRAR